MKYLIDRLKEPSTRLGIATVLGLIAPAFPAYTLLIQGIAGVIAGHTIITPDSKKP